MMKLRLTPSATAKHMLYRCGIRTGMVLALGREPEYKASDYMSRARQAAGVIFEHIAVRTELPKKLRAVLVDYKDFCESQGLDPGTPLQATIDDLLRFLQEKGERVLLYNSSRKDNVAGVPLTPEVGPFRRILNSLGRTDLDVDGGELVFMDFLLVGFTDRVPELEVGEVKFSEMARAFHAFQAAIYSLMLEELARKRGVFKVGRKNHLIIKGLSEIVFVHEHPTASYENVVRSYLQQVLDSLANVNSLDLSSLVFEEEGTTSIFESILLEEVPPLRPTCASCFGFKDCEEKALEKRSVFLYKSVAKVNNTLYDIGFKTGDDVSNGINTGSVPDDLFIEEAFKKEHSLISKHGFVREYSKDPVVVEKVGWSPVLLYLVEDFIFLYGIPSAVTGNPLLITVGVMTSPGSPLDKHLQEKKFKPCTFTSAKQGDRHLFLIVLAPERPYSVPDMYCVYNFIREILELSNEDWSMLYFLDEFSQKTISHFLIERLARKGGTSKSLWFEEKLRLLMTQEEARTPLRERVWGGVLQHVLPTVFVTNEVYVYRAPGLREANKVIGGTSDAPGLIYHYVKLVSEKIDGKYRCKVQLKSFDLSNYNLDGEIVALTDKYSDIFSAAVSMSKFYNQFVKYDESPYKEKIRDTLPLFEELTRFLALTAYESLRLKEV